MIDDIDYSGQGGIATTFDVDQIEVYRGPQGSRIGANALQDLFTSKPKSQQKTFEGGSEITQDLWNINSQELHLEDHQKSKTLTYRLVLRKD